ncbi:hypothetical protein B0T24DRAFT_334922 [Lasiosphaeria ovina]|uniref:Uncharacterized protein n=1 Tax=Lasiosphaeria ovina TaxID=92902 RepID=A0AAE0K8R5_9PEZI|nr:hypothetical protein B0T24DRAFT_334922 [Lasiosphaeria ovina]
MGIGEPNKFPHRQRPPPSCDACRFSVCRSACLLTLLTCSLLTECFSSPSWSSQRPSRKQIMCLFIFEGSEGFLLFLTLSPPCDMPSTHGCITPYLPAYLAYRTHNSFPSEDSGGVCECVFVQPFWDCVWMCVFCDRSLIPFAIHITSYQIRSDNSCHVWRC